MGCEWAVVSGPPVAGWGNTPAASDANWGVISAIEDLGWPNAPAAGDAIWATTSSLLDLLWVRAAFVGIKHRHVIQEELVGTGTLFITGEMQIGSTLEAYFNNLRQYSVVGGASVNQYQSGMLLITTGLSKFAEDILSVDYQVLTECDDPHVHVYSEELTGVGLTASLQHEPVVGSERFFLNTISLRRVSSSPSVNEYTISGPAITLWATRGASDVLVADYLTQELPIVAHDHVLHEVITGTGNLFSLLDVPVPGTERIYHNLLRIKRVVTNPQLNEYVIEGKLIFLGLAKDSGDALTADYVRAELC